MHGILKTYFLVSGLFAAPSLIFKAFDQNSQYIYRNHVIVERILVFLNCRRNNNNNNNNNDMASVNMKFDKN
jgi:hypothetical protein